MTFPTPADIEFFKGAKRIQELWEPKIGDCIWHPVTEQFYADVAVIIKLYPSFPSRVRCVDVSSHNMAWGPTELEGDWFWLPRQGQLQEMLEERGYKDWELFAWAGEEDGALEEGYYCTVYTLDEDGDPMQLCRFGPTPSIALGKCLLEVLKEE